MDQCATPKRQTSDSPRHSVHTEIHEQSRLASVLRVRALLFVKTARLMRGPRQQVQSLRGERVEASSTILPRAASDLSSRALAARNEKLLDLKTEFSGAREGPSPSHAMARALHVAAPDVQLAQ